MKKFLFVSVLSGIFAAVLLGFYVDQMVARRIKSRQVSGATPAAYSAPFTVQNNLAVSQEILLSEITRRGYRKGATRPPKSGEYLIHGEQLELSTNSFVNVHGNQVPSYTYTYHFDTGEVVNHTVPSLRTLILEPEIVSTFGSRDVRSSTYLPLSEIPPFLQHAVVAIEDERFYSHFGIDLIGISRALYRNIRAGRIVEGGSTLTQQLAKNLFFTPRRALTRKILEAFAALSLEFRLSKEKILEMYLNEVYLGQEGSIALHGGASATRSFYGKELKELTLGEAATLAGIIQAPSAYSPRFHPDKAKIRRDIVLRRMSEQGYITPRAAEKEKKKKLVIRSDFYHRRAAPYYTVQLREELLDYVYVDALTLNELQVHTGFSLSMQKCAEEAVQSGINQLEKTYPSLKRKDSPLQAALVAIEPYSGLVKSWVGGRNYKQNQYDHVSQATRQIGSTIKPFLYLTALDGGLNTYKVATARSVLSDMPMKIDVINQDTWEPQNYDKTFHGDVTLRYALEKSLNLPAVYTAQKIGIQTFSRTLKAFELNDKVPAVPSLALGALETSLLELTAAYGALANGGKYVAPRLFRSVVDEEGNIIATSNIREKKVADENATFVLTNILQGVLERGTARRVRAQGFSRPAAGKTGTSNDARDAWFVGYTPTLVTGVWVGYDDNKKVGLGGGSIAAPIWTDYMQCAAPYYQELKFVAPSGVTFLNIDSTTGRRATKECPTQNVIGEVYVRGTEPQTFCPEHGGRSYLSGNDVRPSHSNSSEREKSPQRKRRSSSFWDIVFGGESEEN